MSGINPELGALLQRLNAHDGSRKAMAEIFDTLTPRERVVICGTFGLFDVHVLTADTLAEILGTSAQRIVQIRQKVLRKLSWHTRFPRLLEAEKLITAPLLDFSPEKDTVYPAPEKLTDGAGSGQEWGIVSNELPENNGTVTWSLAPGEVGQVLISDNGQLKWVYPNAETIPRNSETLSEGSGAAE